MFLPYNGIGMGFEIRIETGLLASTDHYSITGPTLGQIFANLDKFTRDT